MTNPVNSNNGNIVSPNSTNSILRFPFELGTSVDMQHYVQFTPLYQPRSKFSGAKPIPTKLNPGTAGLQTDKIDGFKGALYGVGGEAFNVGKVFVDTGLNVGGDIADNISGYRSVDRLRPAGPAGPAIYLPTPSNLTYDFAAEYNTQENKIKQLVGNGDSLVSGGLGGATSLGISKAMQLGVDAQKKIGATLFAATINPAEEQAFEGVSFRTFDFSYEFMPKTEKDAQSLDNICREFRFHMLPEFIPVSEGRIFLYPSEFEIEFYFKNSVNKKLPKIKRCVLTNCSLQYGSRDGWSAFYDGSATQIAIQLTFKELAIVTKEDIKGESSRGF